MQAPIRARSESEPLLTAIDVRREIERLFGGGGSELVVTIQDEDVDDGAVDTFHELLESLKRFGGEDDLPDVEVEAPSADELTRGLSVLAESAEGVDFELPNGDRVEVFAPDACPGEPLDRPVAGFHVDDVREARRELEARGVAFLGDVGVGQTLEWSYFRAPDGHVYEIVGERRGD